MWKKTTIATLVVLLSLVAFQCKNKAPVKGISLDVKFSEEMLSDNLMTDMELIWTTDADFEKMAQDFDVFIHFWHKTNLLFQADYSPEIPTTQWEAGKEYRYTSRIFIPTFIDEFDPDFSGEETLRMSVGFYSPYDRTGKAKQEIVSKKLKILPPPLDTPEIVYEEGWFDLEINPESYQKQWRWTAKEARCIIDNPGRDALLVIRGGLNLDALEDQKVIFKINDLILDEFIPEQSHFEKTYNIKKEMLGDKDEFYLIVGTDKIFVPAQIMPNSNDQRELGLQISFLYFR